MWPFRRAKKSLEGEVLWSVAQGEHDGTPLFARIRQGLAPGPPREPFPYRVGVAVPLRAPDSRGLPQEQTEFEQLAEIEDALTLALESGGKSMHVLSITTASMREFVLYTREPGWVKSIFPAIQSQVHTHELQLSIEHDPEWVVYEQFNH